MVNRSVRGSEREGGSRGLGEGKRVLGRWVLTTTIASLLDWLPDRNWARSFSGCKRAGEEGFTCEL